MHLGQFLHFSQKVVGVTLTQKLNLEDETRQIPWILCLFRRDSRSKRAAVDWCCSKNILAFSNDEALKRNQIWKRKLYDE